eukprot:340468-Hanusia_phi.AAC.1
MFQPTEQFLLPSTTEEQANQRSNGIEDDETKTETVEQCCANAPQTAEKARRSRRSSAGAEAGPGEEEASKAEEEANWAEEQYRAIAPQTAEKARKNR